MGQEPLIPVHLKYLQSVHNEHWNVCFIPVAYKRGTFFSVCQVSYQGCASALIKFGT